MIDRFFEVLANTPDWVAPIVVICLVGIINEMLDHWFPRNGKKKEKE